MTAKPDELFPGPCVSCGDKNYSLSFGGPTICPTCDCGGLIRPSELKNLRKILDEKEEKIRKLREALKNITIVSLNPDWGQIVSSEHYEGAWLDCADIAKAALQETSDQERGK